MSDYQTNDLNDNAQAYNAGQDQFLTNNPDDTNPMQDMIARQELPEDNGTPFSPPGGVQDRTDDNHQVADTGVDEHERYDASIEASSAADQPGQAADEDRQQLPDTETD